MKFTTIKNYRDRNEFAFPKPYLNIEIKLPEFVLQTFDTFYMNIDAILTVFKDLYYMSSKILL